VFGWILVAILDWLYLAIGNMTFVVAVVVLLLLMLLLW
jgi:hypothetical protein